MRFSTHEKQLMMDLTSGMRTVRGRAEYLYRNTWRLAPTLIWRSRASIYNALRRLVGDLAPSKEVANGQH